LHANGAGLHLSKLYEVAMTGGENAAGTVIKA
jgi:hypothetical protein